MAVTLLSACNSTPQEPVLSSPDGRIQLSVKTVDGNLYYSISQDGEELLSDSRLGFVLMGGNYLGTNTEILSVKHSSFKETWETVWGQSREVLDEHNTMLVHTAHLDLEFRAFNDGIGFRYIFPEDLGDIRIREELTEYRFARDDHKIWWMRRSEPYYEAYGEHTSLDEIDCAYTPVTITGADGRFYSIHEAALLDFAKVNLVSDGPACLKTFLTKWSDGTAVYVST
ncbi:MAG: glycoside hydrolase family 97 N-terminal domain-containing protein, partial [Candidatus Cryptobacteroides sp.]